MGGRRDAPWFEREPGNGERNTTWVTLLCSFLLCCRCPRQVRRSSNLQLITVICKAKIRKGCFQTTMAVTMGVMTALLTVATMASFAGGASDQYMPIPSEQLGVSYPG